VELAGTLDALRHAQEVVMRTIYENLFPATVLFGWMLSSAYTLYLLA